MIKDRRAAASWCSSLLFADFPKAIKTLPKFCLKSGLQKKENDHDDRQHLKDRRAVLFAEVTIRTQILLYSD